MTTHEAKADAKAKLNAAGIPFAKLTAKTVGFQDLARCDSIFVTVHGAIMQPSDWAALKAKVAMHGKPSEGGYVLTNEGTKWI